MRPTPKRPRRGPAGLSLLWRRAKVEAAPLAPIRREAGDRQGLIRFLRLARREARA